MSCLDAVEQLDCRDAMPLGAATDARGRVRVDQVSGFEVLQRLLALRVKPLLRCATALGQRGPAPVALKANSVMDGIRHPTAPAAAGASRVLEKQLALRG